MVRARVRVKARVSLAWKAAGSMPLLTTHYSPYYLLCTTYLEGGGQHADYSLLTLLLTICLEGGGQHAGVSEALRRGVRLR